MKIEELLQRYPDTRAEDWRNGAGPEAWIYKTAYVEHPENIRDYAIVCDSARVSGEAWVGDSAWVGGSARVSGSAYVSDSARVSGSAWVGDSAWVGGSARVYRGYIVQEPIQIIGFLPWVINACGPRMVRIGCEIHTFEKWDRYVQTLARKHGQIARLPQIRQALEFCRMWFDANPNAILPNEEKQPSTHMSSMSWDKADD